MATRSQSLGVESNAGAVATTEIEPVPGPSEPSLSTPSEPALSRRLYQHPPVVEALVDIKCDFARPPQLETLGATAPIAGALAWNRNKIVAGTLTFDPREVSSAKSIETLVGYRFSDAEGRRIAQCRVDGFTFSRLRPYEQWELWRDDARAWWDRYQLATSPQMVSRIAFRYINQLEFRWSAGQRLRDFLNVYPEMPSAVPGNMAGFMMRLELPQPQIPGGMLVLTVARAAPAVAGNIAIILDLDLFAEKLRLAPDPEQIWAMLERLHHEENRLFESLVTAKARESFQT